MKLLKVLRSKWWDLFPIVPFAIIAIAEGGAFWVGGVSLIIWGFSLVARYLIK